MNLLASSLWGGLYLVILFALCFAIGVFARLLRVRAASKKKATEKPAPPEPVKEEKKPEEKKEQRVYYIVEKKRVNRSAKYSEPKKIRFE